MAGIRVAGCSGAAYVLWLERHLKNASLGCKRQGGLEVQGLGSHLVISKRFSRLTRKPKKGTARTTCLSVGWYMRDVD